MQLIYKSHPELLALIHNVTTLKDDLRGTEEIQLMTFISNNPRSWDITINNYSEAVWISENRY